MHPSPGPAPRSFLSRQIRSYAPGILTVAILVVAYSTGSWAGSRYKIIYRFPPSDKSGINPTDLISDSAGNLYGTTGSGGENGFGGVYELTPPANKGDRWTNKLLYSFRNGWAFFATADGRSLVLDSAGNLYGVTSFGGHGCGDVGCGTVFELTRPNQPGGKWKETTIYTFSRWDGYQPEAITLDSAGNVYGVTWGGGRYCEGEGCGTVFELTPSARGEQWNRRGLYFFKGVFGNGNGDGANPIALTFDSQRNLYGTTAGGGCGQNACSGTIFRISPSSKNKKGYPWHETMLYRLSGDSNDKVYSGVVLDQSGRSTAQPKIRCINWRA